MSPAWPVLLSQWNWDPGVVAGVLLAAGIYLEVSGRIRWRGVTFPRLSARQTGWFLGGMALLLFALVSPLDRWGDEYLFSAHMFQHLLLMLAVPPMLILGIPGWIVRRAGQVRAIRRVGRFLTRPVTAFILFNLVYVLWHIPAFYEATLRDETIHIVEHLSFLVAGVINWWPVFSTFEDFPPAPAGVQIVYLFLEGIPSTILTAVIVFSGSTLYPTYEAAPRVFGISPSEDQQIAGLGMGSISMVFYLIMFTFVFFRWLGAEERKQEARAKSQ